MCLAVPGRVASVHDRGGVPMAEVELGGAARQVCVQFVPEVTAGDWVVVHLGMALRRVDEREALETLVVLDGLSAPDGGPDDDSVTPWPSTRGRS